MLDSMKRLITHWLPVLLWAALIYMLSSIPSLASGFEQMWDLVLRKAAHVTEYAILGLLLRHALQSTSHATYLAVSLGVLYAGSDEVHQMFVAGRTSSPIDVAIDAFGVLLGAGFFHIRRK